MPIKIQSDLPAKSILEQENIFVMDEYRAMHQDIRPLQVLILNIMPVKQDTELQDGNNPKPRYRLIHQSITNNTSCHISGWS